MIKVLKDWYKEMVVRYWGAQLWLVGALVGMFLTVYIGTSATLTESVIGFFIWFFGLLGMEIWIYWYNNKKMNANVKRDN